MAMHDQGHSAANDEFSLRRLLVAALLTVGNAVVWLTHDRLVAAEIDNPRLTEATLAFKIGRYHVVQIQQF